MLTGGKIRQMFFDYFESKGHVHVPGVSVKPNNDPSLLFVNAGMNQFKDIISGKKIPEYKRVYNSQRCVRAGGKHNDLDDIGKDTYHHTSFEMLGSWTFGDYGKKEAIRYAWELLTTVYKIPKDRLYVTYFGGDKENGLEPDEETRKIWREWVKDENIVPGSMKDNFWEMGEFGPCGPCTEIHYDRIGGRDASDRVNKDDPSVIEVWNNVFMQFERVPDVTTPRGNKLEKLTKLNVDTGMGFERLVSILQNKDSNYDTDIFSSIIETVGKFVGWKYTGSLTDPKDIAIRLISDHMRTLLMCLMDGVYFGINGRESVLRKIFRRVYLCGRDIFNCKSGFMCLLAKDLVGQVGDYYDYGFDITETERGNVIELIKNEENQFDKIIKTGIGKCKKQINGLIKNGTDTFPAQEAFKLYTSGGLPIDVQQYLCSINGLKFDVKGWEKLYEEHRVKSKVKSKKS